MKLKYKRVGQLDLPIVEAGILVDGSLWRYDLKPVENKIIDQLALVWEKKEENGLILLKKTGRDEGSKYDTISDFLEYPPAREKIAVYNTDIGLDHIIENYQAADKNQTFDVPLRGNYEFYTYIGEIDKSPENLFFKFKLKDINENEDQDPIGLYIYYNETLIDFRELEDSADNGSKNKIAESREIELSLSGLPEGVYKIELKANNDIITESIETSQSKLSFVGKIWLFGQDRSAAIYTDSADIQIQTVNPAALQAVKTGNKIYKVEETYKQYSYKLEEKISEIFLEKADIILSGNGVFSLSAGSLLNPRPIKAGPGLDIGEEGIDYILAEYNIPSVKEEWREAIVEFDLSKAYRENGSYGFLFSVPGLKAEDNDLGQGIMISEIELRLAGKSLKEKLF
jgi:hypothetical protein